MPGDFYEINKYLILNTFKSLMKIVKSLSEEIGNCEYYNI